MRQTYLNNARENYLNGFGAGMGHHPYNLNGYPPVKAGSGFGEGFGHYPPVRPGSGFGQYEQAAAGMRGVSGSPDGLGWYIKNGIGDADIDAAAASMERQTLYMSTAAAVVTVALAGVGIYFTYKFFKK